MDFPDDRFVGTVLIKATLGPLHCFGFEQIPGIPTSTKAKQLEET